jgi:hypothetical protein
MVRVGSGSNYGNYAWLMVNYGATVEVRGLIEFEGVSSIPSGATVTDANFDLWISNPNPTNYQFGIYRIIESWSEGTVNGTNEPDHYATAYDIQYITGQVGGPYTFDATTLVQQWVNGTYVNYGMKIKRVDMQNPTNWPYFCSGDNSTTSYHPRLWVKYTATSVNPASFGKVKALYQ